MEDGEKRRFTNSRKKTHFAQVDAPTFDGGDWDAKADTLLKDAGKNAENEPFTPNKPPL